MSTTIKEHWLHYLWKMKRLPINLFTTNGLPIQLLQTGIHNKESGPDFFNAILKIGAITWTGNVEIHIKSSDWKKHLHHLDSSYENVILHVVYEHDLPIYVKEEELPVLELKNYLSKDVLEKVGLFFASRNEIVCASSWSSVARIYVEKQLETAVSRRLQRKSLAIKHRWNELHNDLTALKIELLLKSLLTKVNELPGMELLQRVPYAIVFRLNAYQRTALLFAVANLLPKEPSSDEYTRKLQIEGDYLLRKYNLAPMETSSWKFFGCRPTAYPTIRLVVFAQLLEEKQLLEWEEVEIWSSWWQQLSIELPEYWKTHYHFGKLSSTTKNVLTLPMKNLMIINGVVPFYFWFSSEFNLPLESEKILEQLEKITPEKNRKIEQFIKLGEKPKSAYETQGYLELLNEFCKNHKCLTCQIGTQLIQF